MKILAHRGMWEDSRQANTISALERALAAGYGVETDVRNQYRELVISHDPVGEHESYLPLDALFEAKGARESLLALNIKADGLKTLLKTKLEDYSINNYFVFDMSVPEAVDYLRLGLTVFTRQSELEERPAYYDLASGVWIDSFFQDWITGEQIAFHVANGKRVCIVSSELHGRLHRPFWTKLKSMEIAGEIAICTDFPNEAEVFFNE